MQSLRQHSIQIRSCTRGVCFSIQWRGFRDYAHSTLNGCAALNVIVTFVSIKSLYMYDLTNMSGLTDIHGQRDYVRWFRGHPSLGFGLLAANGATTQDVFAETHQFWFQFQLWSVFAKTLHKMFSRETHLSELSIGVLLSIQLLSMVCRWRRFAARLCSRMRWFCREIFLTDALFDCVVLPRDRPHRCALQPGPGYCREIVLTGALFNQVVLPRVHSHRCALCGLVEVVFEIDVGRLAAYHVVPLYRTRIF